MSERKSRAGTPEWIIHFLMQGPTDHLGPSFDQALGPPYRLSKEDEDENKTSIQIRDIPAAFFWSVLFCSLALLENIRPNIRHILGISLLPLLYPTDDIYRLDPTSPYIPTGHSFVFIAGEIRLVTDSHNGRAKTMTSVLVLPPVTSALGHSLRADPRDLGKSSRPCGDSIFALKNCRQVQTGSSRIYSRYYLDLDLPLRNSDS